MSPRGEQFSGILLATHVPRLWPYCLSVRDERAIYPRGHCHDQKKKKKKKGNPAFLFSRAQPEKLNFTSIRETNWRGEKIWKETKMDEVATTGEWRSFFLLSLLVFFILFIAAWKFICKVRCKVFTSGFYIVDKKRSICAV